MFAATLLRAPLTALLIATLTPLTASASPPTVDVDAYPWLADWSGELPPMVPLSARFDPPAGFTREPVDAGGFAAWLRGLPVRTDRVDVRAYDGRRLWRPSAAIIALDVGTRDLQQCADTAIRLHAEYLWHRGEAHKAAYHFTSGDRSSWRDWRRGERFKVQGSKVTRVRGAGRANTHRNYRTWLTHTFRYAGTASLRHDARRLGDRPWAAGDVLVHPGGPGHAVMLLDVARHPDGRRAALIGQGFMPAEDLHVLEFDSPRVLDGVWFLLPDKAHDAVLTPSWPQAFGRAQAIRFRMP